MTNSDTVPACALRGSTRRVARAGFSLTELLVVMAIMAVLAALITAGAQRTRTNQINNNTTAAVAKIQSGIDLHLKAIEDQVARDRNNRSPEFSALLTYCDNDTVRATSLLTHCRVKQAFPHTAADVATAAGFSVGGVNFPRSPAFAQFQGTSGDPNHVAAALLYVALTGRAIQGTTFNADETVQTGDVVLGTSRKVFTDGWGQPIAYRRWHYAVELNGADYANPNDPFKNLFDPKGKLAGWAGANKTAAETALGPDFYGSGFTFTNDNKQVVAYSAGQNQQYDNLTGDDVVGYKVRAGKKGGQ